MSFRVKGIFECLGKASPRVVHGQKEAACVKQDTQMNLCTLPLTVTLLS